MPIPGDVQYRPGDILKERYRIMDVIGRGSMGEVYSAEHLSLRKHVAIKMMHVHISGNTEALRRFRREASLVANLDNPHICQVTDFDSTEHGDFYIVMELLNGETLRARLEREHTLDVSCALRIMRDLLSALDTTHANHIVYRDVKPENIMLERIEDRDDYVKLIDFGIVRSDDPNSISGFPKITETGRVYGTPQYLSPEQVLGEEVDHRADLYACGCTLFEMLEGVPPFEAKNYVMLLNKHLTLDPPHLSANIEHAGALDALIQKLLQKSPDDRFQTAREVRDAINAIECSGVPPITLNPVIEKKLAHDMSSQRMTPVKATPVCVDAGVQETAVANHPVTRQDVPTLTGASNPNIAVTGVHPATRMSKVFGILKIVAIVLLVLAVGIIFVRQQKMIESHEEQQIEVFAGDAVMDDNLADGKTQDNNPDAEKYRDYVKFVLSKEQIAAYAQSECTIDDAPEIADNEDVRKCVDLCRQGDFETAYATCEKYKNKYAMSMRFNLMRTLVTYATGKFKFGIEPLMKITENEPEAMCHPLVRDINYALIDDDAVFDLSLSVIDSLGNVRNSTRALAWLILNAPCGEYERVFERDLALYDKIDITERDPAGEWLYRAVEMWRHEGTCQERMSNVYSYIVEMMERRCNPDHGDKVNSPACLRCYPVFRQKLADLEAAKNAK